MRIAITEKKQNISEFDYVLMGDVSNSISYGDVVLQKTPHNNRTIRIGFSPCPSEQRDEEFAIMRACEIAFGLIKNATISNLLVDANSFQPGINQLSRIVNIIIDKIYDAAEYLCKTENFSITIFAADKSVDRTIVGRLEKCLNEQTDSTVNNSFGDTNDNLEPKFRGFIKNLESEKPFRVYLIDLINSRGYRKFSEVYKASGISKYTFSKIINFNINPPHKPSKETVAALAIGLNLDISEAQEFYNAAGYYLGTTEFIDKVIRFFINESIYKIAEINYCLNYYGYPPLGERAREEKINIEIK